MGNKETKTYEENFNILKTIAEELRAGNLGIDELIKKGKEASESAKQCLEILKRERGHFSMIEEELNKINESIDKLMGDE